LELAESLVRLRLRPASRWNILLVVLFQWCRYGQKEAWLMVRQIAARTKLSERTVETALADLIKLGILRRVGRRGKLVVVPEALTIGTGNNDPRRDDDGPHDRRHRDLPNGDPSRGPSRPAPVNREKAAFTPKQRKVIENCFAEASELLGEDARDLLLSDHVANKVGVQTPVTYGDAYTLLDRGGCGPPYEFVAAVLELRNDERVQGRELDLSVYEGPARIRDKVGFFNIEHTTCPGHREASPWR
jgi:hypothetical protein